MKKKNDYEFVDNGDGTFKKVVTTEEDTHDEATILNEYLGCIRQELQLQTELEDCKARYEKIAPLALSIIDKYRQQVAEASLSDDGVDNGSGESLENIEKLRRLLK